MSTVVNKTLKEVVPIASRPKEIASSVYYAAAESHLSCMLLPIIFGNVPKEEL